MDVSCSELVGSRGFKPSPSLDLYCGRRDERSGERDLCEHDFLFKGAVQLYRKGELSGVVDVFDCSKCGANDVIVKKPGFDPQTGFGFKPTAPGQIRYVLVCKEGKELDWQVVALDVPTMFVHDCAVAGKSLAVRVKQDLSIESDGGLEHELIPVATNVDRALKLG
jgi:hypothetical protein